VIIYLVFVVVVVVVVVVTARRFCRATPVNVRAGVGPVLTLILIAVAIIHSSVAWVSVALHSLSVVVAEAAAAGYPSGSDHHPCLPLHLGLPSLLRHKRVSIMRRGVHSL
jgi:uncharacterized membrane protein